MQIIKTIAREAIGLFVVDARFTLTLVAWCAIAAAIPALLPNPIGGALVLFGGFAAILIENLRHAAAR
jgi:hypothetical protein